MGRARKTSTTRKSKSATPRAGREPAAPKTQSTRPLPPKYNKPFRLLLATNAAIRKVLGKRHWKPEPGATGFPYERKLYYIQRLRMAIFQNVNVFHYNGPFWRGKFSHEDVEFTCLMIWDAVYELHHEGITLHSLADPTSSNVKQTHKKLKNEQRNLASEPRLEQIIEVLTLHKKACQDALIVSTITEMIQKLVGGPALIFKIRLANKNNNDGRPARTPATASATSRAREGPKAQNLADFATTSAQSTAAIDREVQALKVKFPNFDPAVTTLSALATVQTAGSQTVHLPSTLLQTAPGQIAPIAPMVATPDSGYAPSPTEQSFPTQARLPNTNQPPTDAMGLGLMADGQPAQGAGVYSGGYHDGFTFGGYRSSNPAPYGPSLFASGSQQLTGSTHDNSYNYLGHNGKLTSGGNFNASGGFNGAGYSGSGFNGTGLGRARFGGTEFGFPGFDGTGFDGTGFNDEYPQHAGLDQGELAQGGHPNQDS